MRPIMFGLWGFIVATAHAGAVAQDLPMRGPFEAELKALAAYDRSGNDASIDTLFIGSSSIRLWNVKADFQAYRPLNHGFGGATVRDVLANYDLLTDHFAPETIIVYVGENDIVQGRAADAVAADVIALLARLRSDFPQARILYLSMKASPARWARRSAFAQANRHIRAQSEAAHAFDYIDVSTSLLAAGDAPDLDCYSPDGIHLSMVGYQRWRNIISGYLPGPVAKQASVPGSTPSQTPLPVAGLATAASP